MPSIAKLHSRCVESRSTRITEKRCPPGMTVAEYSLSGVDVTRVIAFVRDVVAIDVRLPVLVDRREEHRPAVGRERGWLS